MPTFIKTGFWEKLQKGYKGYLNLDDLITPYTELKQNSLITNNNQTGTAYTLALTDDYITCTNASDVTVTVPLNSVVAFPVGKVITIEQGGVGQVIISPYSGVTVNAMDNATKSPGQYSAIQLVQKSVNVWTLIGATT